MNRGLRQTAKTRNLIERHSRFALLAQRLEYRKQLLRDSDEILVVIYLSTLTCFLHRSLYVARTRTRPQAVSKSFLPGATCLNHLIFFILQPIVAIL